MLGIFLDTETNGLNSTRHRILEIAYQIVDLKSGQTLQTFNSLIDQSDAVWEGSDPTSLRVNGMTRELLREGLSEAEVAKAIREGFQEVGIDRSNAVFICQNPSFDRAFFGQLIDPDTQEKLHWPYHWLDLASMFWAKTLLQDEKYPWELGFTKDKIARAYGLPSEEAPHRASRGVEHLIACYKAVIGFPAKVF